MAAKSYPYNPFKAFLKANKVSMYSFARLLELSIKTATDFVNRPFDKLTLRHLTLIAGHTNTPIIVILALIRGNNHNKGSAFYEAGNKDLSALSFLTSTPGTNEQEEDQS